MAVKKKPVEEETHSVKITKVDTRAFVKKTDIKNQVEKLLDRFKFKLSYHNTFEILTRYLRFSVMYRVVRKVRVNFR